MIDLEFLQSLIRAIDQSSLDSLEIERGGTRVRLSKTPPSTAQPYQTPPVTSAPPAPAASQEAAPGPADAGSAPAGHLLEIKSPMVGTFYRAPAPDAPAYVDVGSRVKKGDTLCIIEAMKLMNELESEVVGTVAEVLVESGHPVEYGQVLFRIEPA